MKRRNEPFSKHIRALRDKVENRYKKEARPTIKNLEKSIAALKMEKQGAIRRAAEKDRLYMTGREALRDAVALIDRLMPQSKQSGAGWTAEDVKCLEAIRALSVF